MPHARIVFDVSLKGSAGKLVTVRSALLVVNKLPEIVEIKLESQLPKDTGRFLIICCCCLINNVCFGVVNKFRFSVFFLFGVLITCLNFFQENLNIGFQEGIKIITITFRTT